MTLARSENFLSFKIRWQIPKQDGPKGTTVIVCAGKSIIKIVIFIVDNTLFFRFKTHRFFPRSLF